MQVQGIFLLNTSKKLGVHMHPVHPPRNIPVWATWVIVGVAVSIGATGSMLMVSVPGVWMLSMDFNSITVNVI